ncbi:MAG: reprolysin-like metallopeptidase [Bacteroidota bacterium]
MMNRSILFLLLLSYSLAIFAQSQTQWTDRQASELYPTAERLHTYTEDFRAVELDINTLAPALLADHKQIRQADLPLPDGSTISVQLAPSSVMAPGLAERYPGIKTYRILPRGKQVLGGCADWTHQGFHAVIRTVEGTYYIDPVYKNNTNIYAVYDVSSTDHAAEWNNFSCSATGKKGLAHTDIYEQNHDHHHHYFTKGGSVIQRKYRLAMACTGEYSEYHAGNGNPTTVAISLSAIVTTVNRVNEVFGQDVGIQMELIENNDEIIFLDPDTDPYVNQTDEMLNDNPGAINPIIGINTYDIGHVISTGPASGQGVASLAGVCQAQDKARATSTRNNPVGDPFIIAILCHEMGHQFSATHVQSGCQNVSVQTAVEPGGGTTIMGYAGICPPGYNIQSNTEPYYNNVSMEQMRNYTRNGDGALCGEAINDGNTAPEATIDYVDGFFIPISTPFELEGSGMDMEDDDLTYNWEQSDTEPSIPYDDDNGEFGPTLGNPVGDSPLFRSYEPSTSTNRVLPRIQTIISNAMDNAEVLPTYSRNLTFRFTVRDNHPTSGAFDYQEVAFRSTETAGPFLVTAPNTSDVEWAVGAYEEVTWDVANTDNDIVDCRSVDIRLSTDGGFTYPITLLEDTPNDGSAFVNVPDAVGDDVRVRVQASDNIFFDISNRDFSIVPATAPGYTLDYGPQYQEICSEEFPATLGITTDAILGFDQAINLAISSELPDGVTATFDDVTLTPGGSTTLTVDFAGSGISGPVQIEISTIVPDVDTLFRTFLVDVIDSDFSALALTGPVDGLTGVGLDQSFAWSVVDNADTYDFQLSTNPDFAPDNIVEGSFGQEGNTYETTVQLAASTLYFWRVRASNVCGSGPWLTPRTFHTEVTICDGVTSSDTPVTLPGVGPLPTRMSTIGVDFSGTISEVNIPFLEVVYQPSQNFDIFLTSISSGTEIQLYDGTCFSNDRINAGFNDNATEELACPPFPEPGNLYLPTQPLSTFNGENSMGNWELKVVVNQAGFGSPGAINDWRIEFCATGAPSAPALETNTDLCVIPGAFQRIEDDNLSATDTEQGASELSYWLVSLPSSGILARDGATLAIGDRFSQADVNAGLVRYTNTDANATTDSFEFVIEDGTGGFLPVTTLNIGIDSACAPESTNEVPLAERFRLFPNPTEGALTLAWSEPTADMIRLEVMTIQGQLIQTLTIPNGTTRQLLDLSAQPRGVYLLRAGRWSERVIVD